MIRVRKTVCCEGRNCRATIVGCDCIGCGSCDANCISVARRSGWKRTHGEQERIIDLCPTCSRVDEEEGGIIIDASVDEDDGVLLLCDYIGEIYG